MDYLNIKHLNFGYLKDSFVLKDLSFFISDYGIYILLGRNGSGKTTLMKILIKYLPYRKGSVKINGAELSSISLHDLSKNVAFLESEIPMISLKVREVISWGFYPYGNSGNVKSVAEMLHLDNLLCKDFNSLSTGEKKRVLLARIFAQNSKIVLIDEPFNFLDPYYQTEIALILKKLAENRVVLISTHNLDAAQFVGKKIFLLDNGRIIAEKTGENLFSDDLIINIFGVDEQLKPHFKRFFRIKRC